jgi:dihydrofolate reductase
MYNSELGVSHEVVIYAAFAKERLIATKKGVPWKKDQMCRDIVDEDISRLFGKIAGSSVIIGRKTYEEIAALESDPITNAWNAQVIVMSRDPNYQVRHEQVRTAISLDEALEKSDSIKISILGGAEVYQTALDHEELVDFLELTLIHRDYGNEGVKFPEFDRGVWATRSFVKKTTRSGVDYTFLSLERNEANDERESYGFELDF